MKMFFDLNRAAVVLAGLCTIALSAGVGNAGTIGVSSLASSPGVGVWGTYFGTTAGGTATIDDLTGEGGDLETNQPLGPSAVQLTTGGDVNERAQIGIYGSFGDAQNFLNNLDVGYSYYKDGTVGGTNLSAAPSLKLVVSSPDSTGPDTDSYGELIYEPNWNQPSGGSSNPPANSWQTVSIDSSIGSSDTATGGWWWSGGFGESSGAGGPPIRSSSQWASLFSADTDFGTASIIGINVGVGTYNLNQVGYFDAVRIGDTTYDFGAASVPEPTSLAIFGAVGLVAAGMRWRKKRSV